MKGCKWSIGDGSKASIWFDWWCGEGPLASLFPHSHLINSDQVETILEEVGRWDIDKISTTLHKEALDLSLKVHLPRFVTFPDLQHWKGSSCGIFTTTSAYDLVCDTEVESINWLWLWKLKLPQKLKGFLWLALQHRLLTNE